MITVDSDVAGLKKQVEAGIVPHIIAYEILIQIIELSDTDETHSEMEVMLSKRQDDLRQGERLLDYDYYFGGQIFIVENYNDLKDIKGMKKGSGGELFSLLDGGIIFDIADPIEGYIRLCLITTNSGGDFWYVPIQFLQSCPELARAVLEAKNDRNG